MKNAFINNILRNKLKKITLCFSVIFLSACSADLSDYKKSTPQINIKEFFTGRLVAWGMVQNYQHKLIRRFCVEIDGTWQGNKGVLAEKFYFNDGEISYRNWQLEKMADGKYQGSAEDVIGEAYGQEIGHAFNWQYQLSIPVDGKNLTLHLDDWMYQIDNERVFNRTTMKKFGLTVGEITLFFNKQNNASTCQ